jgi:hypothetical protein
MAVKFTDPPRNTPIAGDELVHNLELSTNHDFDSEGYVEVITF